MNSKFTKNERLKIGRKIYEGKISTREAAEVYGISFYTARDYYRAYKAGVELSTKSPKTNRTKKIQNMTRDELIEELIRARKECEMLEKEYAEMMSRKVKE